MILDGTLQYISNKTELWYFSRLHMLKEKAAIIGAQYYYDTLRAIIALQSEVDEGWLQGQS
jgi:hypothetical protein